MPTFPLRKRIVEVIADRGKKRTPRYLYGSGCLVAGRTVLTAAHVVSDAEHVLIRDVDKVEYQAVIDLEFVAHVDGDGPDVALVEIADRGIDVPPMRIASVDRNGPAGSLIEECHAFGYPEFKEYKDVDGRRVRETAQAVGYIPVLSDMVRGLLSLEVTSAPASLPPGGQALAGSSWSGMSGGPVVAQGHLIGVVTELAPRVGPSEITVTPLMALGADQEHPQCEARVPDSEAWWVRLGVIEVDKLPSLPPPRKVPPYLATVQALRDRTKVLSGREYELDQIAAFATGDDGYRWLVGESYAGKTSLLAHAVAQPPENADVICYFLSRSEARADSVGFLAAVIPQLAHLLDQACPSADQDEFRALWQWAAECAAAEGRHLLLVVDGLDEDVQPDGQPSVASLLPEIAGAYVHILVSSRSHLPIHPDLRAVEHPLCDAPEIQLEPFEGSRQKQDLAKQEIRNLLRGNHDIGYEVLGLLTAAAGPLTAEDLAALMTAPSDRSERLTRLRKVRLLLEGKLARSLQEAAPEGSGRYQFAHKSLQQYAESQDDLNHPDDRRRIHKWAEDWQAQGWPVAQAGTVIPRYLLDTYPATLMDDHERLGRLACDIGWVEAALISAGVDQVLADLRRAAAANPDNVKVQTMARTVTGQAHNLRDGQVLHKPGYVLRQLWMQAAQSGSSALANQIRRRLRSSPGNLLLPLSSASGALSALAAELGRHRADVDAMVALPDGRIVTAGQDGRILVWDPGNPGTGPTQLGHHKGAVGTVTALPDGHIITLAKDGRVLVWDPGVPGSSPTQLGHHMDAVDAVAALPDSRIVTVGWRDGQLLAWNPKVPGSSPTQLGHHTDWRRKAAALPDGRIVTAGQDGRILVWDPEVPGCSPAQLGHHQGGVYAVATLPDGRIITAGWRYERDGILVWDPDAPGNNPAELGHPGGAVEAIAVLPDGRFITLVTNVRGGVLVWDPDAAGSRPAELGHHEGGVQAVAVLPDGRPVTVEQVFADGSGGQIRVWNPSVLGTSPIQPDDPHRAAVDEVAVLPDGRIVTFGQDGRILLWDPEAPGSGPTQLGHCKDEARHVAVLPDGRTVIAGQYGRLLVWNPGNPGTRFTRIGHHRGAVDAIASLSDGRIVTAGQDGRILAWNLDSAGGRPIELGCHTDNVYDVGVLPDGRIVTFGRDRRILAWDPGVPGGSPIELGHHDDEVVPQAVLNDGRIVTAGRNDGEVVVWDPRVPGGGPIELGHHEDEVCEVAVLLDERIVTFGGDRRVLVWDPHAPGSSPVQLGQYGDEAHGVAMLPDGRVATTVGHGRVLIWSAEDPTKPEIQIDWHVRSVTASQHGSARPRLVLSHLDGGFSVWSPYRW